MALELRIALTAEDYDRLVSFYRDALGLEPGDMWTDNGRGQVFLAGSATLEILDPTHAAWVDQTEAGKRTSGQIRFAIKVPDLDAALQKALAWGAAQVHPPIITPWGDYNVRLQAPDGLQITLFQAAQSPNT
jgi:predicted enzyme related to lactoylglutathione lyase